jgi:hypothetical protein
MDRIKDFLLLEVRPSAHFGASFEPTAS